MIKQYLIKSFGPPSQPSPRGEGAANKASRCAGQERGLLETKCKYLEINIIKLTMIMFLTFCY